MRRDYVYGYPTKDESSVRCFVAVSCGSGCDHPHPKVAFHSDLMYCMDCHKWFLPVYASDIEFSIGNHAQSYGREYSIIGHTRESSSKSRRRNDRKQEYSTRANGRAYGRSDGFPLAGCGNEADADDVEGGSDCIDVRGDFTGDECRIELHDGRTVTCINFNTYKGEGGLSCDWDNASGKDGETK